MLAYRAIRTAPARARSLSAAAHVPKDNDVLFIDGVRTPFQLSFTGYKKLMAVELARSAVTGLIAKTAVDPAKLGALVLGTVIQEVCDCEGKSGRRVSTSFRRQ